MLHKTRGIVLRSIPHTESSLISRIFTERFGLQSYMVYGARKHRAKIPANILQPLHLLEMVVYHKESGNIQKISDARQEPIFQAIPYDIEKSTVALFLAEVLNKVIKQSTAEGSLFAFIYAMVAWFDSAERRSPNFHLYFLLKLTQHLGFYPSNRQANQSFFDLKNGVFAVEEPAHPLVINNPLTAFWDQMLSSRLDNIQHIPLTTHSRRLLLSKILDFYRLHIDGFGEVRSRDILEEVME